MAVFAVFAIDMSPHPGDTMETVFSVEDDATMNWAEAAPAFENGLHLEQINFYNDTNICLSENEVIGTTILSPAFNADMAVSYIGYEMEPSAINNAMIFGGNQLLNAVVA